MGPTPATHLDLWAWTQIRSLVLLPWETEALLRLGVAWSNAMNATLAAPADPKGSSTK